MNTQTDLPPGTAPLPTSTGEEVKTCATTINKESQKMTDSSPINGPTPAEAQKYAYSLNEEDYIGEYDTQVQAAVEAFLADYDASHVFVGECVKPKLEDYLDVAEILERTMDANPEQLGGESAWEWLDVVLSKKEALVELEERLQQVVKDWVAEHDLHPTFFNVKNIEEIERSEIMEDEDYE
jgi:hypothetical protein